jgi:hypothetical protein
MLTQIELINITLMNNNFYFYHRSIKDITS